MNAVRLGAPARNLVEPLQRPCVGCAGCGHGVDVLGDVWFICD
jgi:hypothetical protein